MCETLSNCINFRFNIFSFDKLVTDVMLKCHENQCPFDEAIVKELLRELCVALPVTFG